MPLRISSEKFGETPQGEAALYTMTNSNGIGLKVTDYGGIITSITTPDAKGIIKDIVLGFDNLEEFLEDHSAFGAFIGRYGNRIANGQFVIDGTIITTNKNHGKHTLHGGFNGFAKKLWASKQILTEEGIGIEIFGTSPDGDEGFPGNLDVSVQYLLTEQNEVIINYQASTDKPTVINLTNHAYFNLKGEGDIIDHKLLIPSEYITEVDEDIIPTGNLLAVENTAFDFRKLKRIGDQIDEINNTQIQRGSGYDHNFILSDSSSLKSAAFVIEPSSGRTLEVLTTEPAVQLYCGNWLNGIVGKGGKPYHRRTGFCLETQHFPDSPNHSHFPNTSLNPEEIFSSRTIYRLGSVGGESII